MNTLSTHLPKDKASSDNLYRVPISTQQEKIRQSCAKTDNKPRLLNRDKTQGSPLSSCITGSHIGERDAGHQVVKTLAGFSLRKLLINPIKREGIGKTSVLPSLMLNDTSLGWTKKDQAKKEHPAKIGDAVVQIQRNQSHLCPGPVVAADCPVFPIPAQHCPLLQRKGERLKLKDDFDGHPFIGNTIQRKGISADICISNHSLCFFFSQVFPAMT